MNTLYSEHIYGNNPTIGKRSFDLLWFHGGAYPWPQHASPLRIKAGGSVEDDVAGTGARSIRIEGLDQNLLPVSELLSTSGPDQSALTGHDYLRILRARVECTGTYSKANTDNIIIEDNQGTELANIEAGIGRTQLGFATTPATHKAFLRHCLIRVDGETDIRVFVRPNVLATTHNIRAPYMIYQQRNVTEYTEANFVAPIEIPAGADIWVEGKASGKKATNANVFFDLFLAAI